MHSAIYCYYIFILVLEFILYIKIKKFHIQMFHINIKLLDIKHNTVD
jgi:hypothetical protein